MQLVSAINTATKINNATNGKDYKLVAVADSSDLIDSNRREREYIYFSLNTQQTSQNGFKLDKDSRKGVVIFFYSAQ